MSRTPPFRTPLRVGIVGAGLMGRWHAHAAQRAGGRIVAVLDRDADAAAALAQRCPGAVVVDALDRLTPCRVEVAHVCTPLATHERLAVRLLEAGVHVLAEKPLTDDADGTARLLARADQAERRLCPVHQFPFQDGARWARAALARIGAPVHLQAVFRSAGAEGPGTPTPDAVVADILPHPLSLFEAFVPGCLDVLAWTALRPAPGELRAAAVQDGVSFGIDVSMRARPTETTLVVAGTDGTFTLNLFHGYAVFEPGAVSRARKIVQPFDRSARHLLAAAANLTRRTWRQEPAYPGLRPLVAAFYRAVRGRGDVPLAPEVVLRTAHARDALLAAAPVPSAA